MTLESLNEIEKQNVEIERLVEKAVDEAVGISRENYDKSSRFPLAPSEGKKLYYFGAEHSSDPKHLQFSEIKAIFHGTLGDTPKEKCAVIVESTSLASLLKTTPIDENRSIEEGGEPAFTINLANELSVDYFCFEPDKGELINHVAEKHSKDLAFLHYAGRAILGFGRKKHEGGLREYFKRYLARFEDETKWEGFDYTFDHLEEVYRGVTGRDFTPEEEEKYRLLYDPTRDDSILNEVSRTDEIYRDIKIVGGIRDLVRRGKSCFFVTYGSGHALTQRAALEYVLKVN